jgi:hypothetical protein
LPLLTDGNGKTGSTVAIVGENPSAKGRLLLFKRVYEKCPFDFLIFRIEKDILNKKNNGTPY